RRRGRARGGARQAGGRPGAGGQDGGAGARACIAALRGGADGGGVPRALPRARRAAGAEAVGGLMRFAFFIHSAVSDWNHGNAHFLRGLMSALVRGGHTVACWEPRRAWSLENLLADHGVVPVVEFARAYPELDVRSYDSASHGLEDELRAACVGADVVMVHEWNEPRVANLLASVARAAGALAVFHDTHHRPWSDPGSIARFDLQAFDGVLAFGDVLG